MTATTRRTLAIAVVAGLASTAAAKAETVLFYEDFQDGDANGWRASGKGDVGLSTYAGNVSMRITRRAAALTAVPIKGYTTVTVSGTMAGADLEDKDACLIETSTDDGAAWTEILRVSDGQDDSLTLHQGRTTLMPADGAERLVLRLRADANADNDTCWADTIRVTAPDEDGARIMHFGRDFLLNANGLERPASTAAYAPSSDAQPPTARIEGTLHLHSPVGRVHSRPILDARGRWDDESLKLSTLPDFSFDFIQAGDALIPVLRGAISSTHPGWEFILEPGRVWSEPGDGGYSRAALPFTLEERNANCMHNGLLTFLFNASGETSRAALQVTSETCGYLQFDLWGLFGIDYAPKPVPDAALIAAEYARGRAERMPVRPITDLMRDHPGADTTQFGASAEVDPTAMTAFGFFIDGVHYAGGCSTRTGPHPYCDSLDLPSYSLAKSVFAGIGLARLAQLYPGAPDAIIADFVAPCARAGHWDDVTFENTADMATGNFQSLTYDEDERAEASWTFLQRPTHAQKIADACALYPRKTAPGSQWVYHTSDTYILGTAIGAYLKSKGDPSADVYTSLIYDPVLRPLGFSPTSAVSRRTLDAEGQPFAGWGLSFLRDDLVKLAAFLLDGSGRVDGAQAVSPARLAAALQRDPDDRGLPSLGPDYRYNDGFWAWNAATMLDCLSPVWIPFLSGYGGITLALMPNGTAYYYVSDGYDFAWGAAVQASHRIRSLCPG